MTIAVHINTTNSSKNFIADFYTAVFSVIAHQLPQHQFILIIDKLMTPQSNNAANLRYFQILPFSRFKYVQQIWFQFKLSAFFKKNNVDYFFSEGSMLHSKLLCRQILYEATDVVLNHKKTIKKLNQVDTLVVPNHFVKQRFVEATSIPEAKIVVVEPAVVNTLSAFTVTEKESAKSVYCDGKEFFSFFTEQVSSSNIILMLKAFSIFKKWQRSNMQLHIVTPNAQTTNILQLLENYKFKGDVVVVSSNSAQPYLPAAYASIFLSESHLLTKEILCNLNTMVPLLLPQNKYNCASFGNAASYFEIDADSLSKQLILIYKDESYRTNMISAMQQLAPKHTVLSAAQKIMSLLPKN